MKKILFTICLFWVGQITSQQVDVVVPDGNFETYLEGINEPAAPDPGPGIVRFLDISTVTTISAPNRNIASITGVEEFFNLQVLEVQQNPITTLAPAFGLVNLVTIRAFLCDIEGILDFSAMPNLREVGLDYNVSQNLGAVRDGIDGIIFDPNNIALERLDIRGNDLKQLILPQGAPLEILAAEINSLECGLNISDFIDTLTDFSACENPNLQFVYVNQADIGGLSISANTCPYRGSNDAINGLLIDNGITSFEAIEDAVYVSIPDNSFEQLLIDNGYDSEGSLDGQILRCDAESVVHLNLTRFEQVNSNNGFNSYDNIYVTTEANQAGGIGNLTGLDAFVNIEILYIQGNQGGGIQNSFSALDLSANNRLEQVFAFWNPNLTSVNFNGLTELKNFGLNGCNLSTLDLSNNVGTNAAFLDVNAGQNQLTSVNFGSIGNITDLQLLDNQLTEVDISNFDGLLVANPDPADGGPDPAFRITGNAGLTCIQVSDITNAITQTAVDTGGEGNNWQIPNGDGNPDIALFKTNCNCPYTSSTLVFNSQEDIDTFASACSITSIDGNLIIRQDGSGSNITNLNPLSVLTTMTSGSIIIEDNTSLTSLSGLQNIVQNGVVEFLSVQNNDLLGSISGLSGITSTQDATYIRNNPQLTSLDGLQNITDFGDLAGPNLWIDDNDNLLNLSGLGTIDPQNLQISENDNLTSLNGPVNIASVNSLTITNNPQLSDISALAQTTGSFGDSGNVSIEITNNILLDEFCDLYNILFTSTNSGFTTNCNFSGNQTNPTDCQEILNGGVCSTATPDDFILSVKTDNLGTSGDNQFAIPTNGGGYNYNVNWGDGNTDNAVNGAITHTYAAPGTYTVTISDNSGVGTGFPRIYFNGIGDAQKVLDIEQWGTGLWTSMANSFEGCSNLTILTAPDTPNLTNVTDLTRMFFNATQFNTDISNWDVSTITAMTLMFAGASAFNAEIGSWNTSNVQDMSFMFFNASVFNGNISSWDVSQVTTMELMFDGADGFNQDIGNWNTGNVTTMRRMFQGNDAFNQDVSNWDTSNVTIMEAMFNGATAFNQNIGDLNVSQVTNMTDMLNGSALSVANYDATLIGWNGQTLQNGVELGAAGLEYCNGEIARQNLIDNFGWNITGDTRDAGCDACTVVRFADDTLRAFLVNDANNGNFLDQNNQPVDLDPTGSGNVCVQEAAKVVFLDVSGLGLVSLMGSNIDLNNPISAASSPDAANPTDPTNGLIAFSNLTELVISNNNFDNGLQVPNVSLEKLVANNCIQANSGATWTASVGDPSFYLLNVTEFEFQENWTNIPAFTTNFEGLNNVTIANLSDTNLSGLEITATIWNQLVSLTYENTNSLTAITGLQNAGNLEELLINGSKFAGVLDLTGLTTFRTLQADDNDITSIIVSSSPDLQTITANRNINLTTVQLPLNGNGMSSLFLNDNNIEQIDISGVDSGLGFGATTFSILNNDNLSCIKVSNEQQAIDRANSLTYAIPNNNTGVFTEQNCSCTEVTVNDPVLLNILLTETFEDVNGDTISIAVNGIVCRELAETIVRLDIDGRGISDLTGLEVFSSLRFFNAFDNPALTSLQPIEGLTQMEELRAFDSNIDGNLDLTSMADLRIVGLDNNTIDGIRFNLANTVLDILDIKNNELTQLQLPTAPRLTRLIIANNQLQGSLDIRAFSNILDDFWACGNQYECIQVNQVDLDNLPSRLSSSTCNNPPSRNDLVDDWLVDDNDLFSVDCNFDFVVNIQASDPDASETGPDNGEFIISLDRINDSGQDVTITFDVGGNAIAGVGNDYQTIPNTAVIAPGNQEVIIPVIVFNNDDNDDTETVVITIQLGTGYTIGTSGEATVTIQNDLENFEGGVPNIDTNTFSVTVTANSCRGQANGSIVLNVGNISNTFSANLDGDNRNLSSNSTEIFEGRSSGEYSLRITSAEFPEWTLVFGVTVGEAAALNLQGVTIDDETDMAVIRLLGSNQYTITNNGKEFRFGGFEDDVPAFIRIPIEMGLNNLTVKGEKACQGIINEQVYFGELLAYPIPTMDYLRLEGLPQNIPLRLQLFDVTGKLVYKENWENAWPGRSFDISRQVAGKYFLRITGTGLEENIQLLKR